MAEVINAQCGYLPESDRTNNVDSTVQVRIKVISGQQLAKKDIFGASDPYVRIDLNTISGDVNIDSVLTKTKKKTLNPKWNEEFVFRVKPSEHKLVFQVFDENRLTRDDFLGMVELPLVNFAKEQEGRVIPTKCYPLRPRRSVGARSRVRGTLEIYHAYIRDLDATNETDWEFVNDENNVAATSNNLFVTNAGVEPLPPNWEERQDANGRTYFVNHRDRTTQWERPTAMSPTEVDTNTVAAFFHRRFHISVDESDNRSIQESDILVEPHNYPRRFSLEPRLPRFFASIDEDTYSTSSGDDESDLDGPEANAVPDGATPFVVPLIVVGDTVSLNSELGRDSPIHSSGSGGGGIVSGLNSETVSRRNSTTSLVPARPAPDIPRPATAPVTPLATIGIATAAATIPSADSADSAPPDLAAELPDTATTTLRLSRDGATDHGSPVTSVVDNQPLGNDIVNLRAQQSDENDELDVSDSGASTNPNNTANGGRASSASLSRRSSSDENSSSRQPTPTNNDGDLPAGWSLQVAPNGRIFFIDHNQKRTSWVDPRTGRASPLPNAAGAASATARPEDDLGPLPEGWEERVHSDGRIFYIDHNNRVTQWEDPRLSNPNIAGQAVPYSRDYKQKYEYFKGQLRKPTNVPNKFEIKIRRISILEDSYRIINSVMKTDLLKTKLWIEFEGEAGLDYGGLAREWFFLLSKEMFNPYYGLFEYSAMDNYTLQINPFSGLCNEEHLSYFKFIGRIAGMAVYHGKLLDAFFIRPFYKMMLQKAIDLKDMESVDTEYHNSLLWIKENDPNELMLTFCVDEETFGQTSQRDLKPNGGNIEVTNENKDEYIKLVIEWRFVARVKEQMTAFLEGFGTIVPLNLLKLFDENELELLMCGIQNIDVRDWKKNTLYKGDYYGNHVIVQWFWRAVLSFSNEMRARLLQFVTGTSRVPMNGFKELYGSNGPQIFTIEKWGTPENFPRAHTCFNRLDLPPYESYLQLKDKLVKAIEGSQGFAGVD